jgi:hypothetical protein
MSVVNYRTKTVSPAFKALCNKLVSKINLATIKNPTNFIGYLKDGLSQSGLHRLFFTCLQSALVHWELISMPVYRMGNCPYIFR